MTERKCGICREPGHTRKNCTAEQPQAPAPVDDGYEADGMHDDQRAQELSQAHATTMGQIAEFKEWLAEERAAAPQTAEEPDAAARRRAFGQQMRAERLVHVHRFQYGDDGKGHSGSFCDCGMEEPDAPASGVEPFTRPEGIYSGPTPGPWFEARFPGICERGGEGFEQGEEIRADGEGGYECRDCVSDDERTLRAMENPPSRPVPMAQPHLMENLAVAEAIDRMKPVISEMVQKKIDTAPIVTDVLAYGARVRELFDAPAEVPATVTEGPRTDRNGHRLKDPVLGDYRRYKNGNIKSIRRVTTFNDAVDSKDNLTGWMKRNVLIGASAHPEIVAEAHGLTHEEHKDRLNQLVKRLEEAAGSKKAADLGTLVHKLTERVDAGEPLSVVPAQFLPLVMLYRQTLADAGLRVVPGLIENTTFIPEWGGVAGSFDRVYEHIATRRRYIGDVKTGKTMDWGWQKIECQLAVYGQGYNRFGTYDWERGEWLPPEFEVSLKHGIVVHLPVSGELVGTCSLLEADLTAGWAYAAVCGAVWEQRAVKAKASPWKPAGGSQPVRQWDVEFSSVTSRQQAAYLWNEARSLGVPLPELDRLVRLAQATLSMS